MKIIIIGAAGHQGREYFNLLKDHYNICGVVDTNLKALNDQYPDLKNPDLKKVATVNEALNEIDFDTAIISIPHIFHSSVTIPLIKNNKKIIKEKPLALNLNEIENYTKNFTSDSYLLTIVQRNFNDVFLDALKNLSRLGKIYNFKYEYFLNLKKSTEGWRANYDIARGGVILDMGYHIIDILLKFFGYPEEYFGFISY